jgi:hypothetical protein
MKSIIKLSLLSLTATSLMVMASPAYAGGYESTLTTKISTPVKVDIKLSEDLAYRAENLPKKLSDRGGSSRLNSGFANNGYYGDKALEDLQNRLERRLNQSFEKSGIVIDDTAPVTLVVTIEDAKPNRPTFRQLSKEPALSYQSFGLGGAEISSELIDASGNSLGQANYEWFETFIQDARFGGTWSDADVAFRRYAKKLSKELS